VTEERDPDMDFIPRREPCSSLVPPTSPWNTIGKNMIGMHTSSWAAISPTLISPKRYEWLHAAHSRLNHSKDFTHDLLKLMSRYHPRSKSLNPQGLPLKLANN
jgi:hypothetical protein